jgi:hypothetical protein
MVSAGFRSTVPAGTLGASIPHAPKGPSMKRTVSAVLAGVVATAALAPAAGAATSGSSASHALDVTGAYLYLDHDSASKKDFVRVVFETAGPLPRRADGAIQATASIDSFNHSIASVKRGTSVYTAAAPVKGNSITSLNGDGVGRRGAKVGSTYTVRIFDRDGHRVTRRMTLRAERAGDDAGRPLTR